MENITPSNVIGNMIDDALDKKSLRAGIEAMRTRTDFRSTLERDLAGIAAIPAARSEFMTRLSTFWEGATLSSFQDYTRAELVIGSGPHAATYCATRVREGFPRPYVIERYSPGSVGGTFTSGPFLLNSRNRPGPVGSPDQDIALNDIPGGPIQPSMVSALEYPTSMDMVFCIRAALAQYANVIPSVEVTDLVSTTGSDVRVITSDGSFTFGRVIDARGCGNPIAKGDKNILTFPQLLNRMRDMSFPLQGIKRVAVIGGGNSGACAAECFLGLAPAPHMSMIGMDYVSRVDWYTNGDANATCEGVRASERGRYVKLGQFMEGNVSNSSVRLKVFPYEAYAARAGDMVTVADRTYDLAVVCTGNKLVSLGVSDNDYISLVRPGSGNGPVIAKKMRDNWYKIGPAASIDFSASERAAEVVGNNEANKVAMFRLTPKTAALATMLPGL